MRQPVPDTPKESTKTGSFSTPLPVELLYRRADLSGLLFATTAEISPLDGDVAQQRVVNAVQFSTTTRHQGFNLFVIGPREACMRETVTAALKEKLQERSPPSDWIYVNNFESPNKPVAIEMPTGTAPDFHEAMHELVEDLRATLPAAFDSEDYSRRRGAIDEAFQKAQADAFVVLREKANQMGVAILRTPLGFALAPMADGTVVPPEVFAKWPEEKQAETSQNIQSLEKELERAVRQVPQIEKERRDAIRKLNRETAEVAVGHLIEEMKLRFSEMVAIVSHLERVRGDLLKNVAMFTSKDDEISEIQGQGLAHSPFERYEVNVLISHSKTEKIAPLVEEIHPTLSNLIGRVEHIAHQGTLFTDFRMIRPGALHKANGGFLLLNIRDLLLEPFSWAAIKRSLQRGTIVIEDASRFLGFASTVALEPDPIPLNVKVILFGDRILYYLLAEFDPELGRHFKVLADFDDEIERSPENEKGQAHKIASILAQEGLRPMSRDAVGLVIERAARLAGDSKRLSLLTENIRDLVAEADHWAEDRKQDVIDASDVEKAIEQWTFRNARVRDRLQESILRDLAFISTSGSTVGQVNALSVFQLAGFSFGRPSRVTCRVRPGGGKVIDIEREVKLGGPTHSKGVLILSGFLAGRYALDTPMSLFASLVFEQSYGGVEGDSASAAELLSVLSALADVPLRQGLAITGSINQFGQIQAIGGVNEKIEGFFDICKERGLTGKQGVVIPRANIQNLMLRSDVVEACRQGRFSVYAIETIDEGIMLLTGMGAGDRAENGAYPEETVNARVETRLRAFADVRRRFEEPGGEQTRKAPT